MKKMKIFLSMLLMVLLMVASAGCYVVQGQRMGKVKGTYELTSYYRTNGKTNATTNYLETQGYQVYLVVTGNSSGYLVYKDNDEGVSYYKTLSLTYTYQEESDNKLGGLFEKVEYVTFQYAGEEQKFGVTSDHLNYSRPAIKLSDKIYSDDLGIGWTRVDKATDLSYAEAKLGALTAYVESQG